MKKRKVISKKGNLYYTSYNKKGDIHGNCKPERPYSDYNRQQCLIRDNFTCQLCGAIGNLDVHHLDNNGRHLTKTPNNSLDNLQTLCHSCHLKLHYGVLGKDVEILSRRQKGQTLQDIANYYGISRQRIHQIEQKALVRLPPTKVLCKTT